ncbi:MAG: VRR-NUC domain-containing protein [Chloroflexota bacterium]
MPRTKAKTDENQSKIVEELRDKGVSITCTHQMGRGFPDLVAGWNGMTFLFEVKTKNGRLTSAQTEFIAAWKGQVDVISSSEDALAIMKRSMKKASQA